MSGVLERLKLKFNKYDNPLNKNPFSQSLVIRETQLSYPTLSNILDYWSTPVFAAPADHDIFVKRMSMFTRHLVLNSADCISWTITFLSYHNGNRLLFKETDFINTGYKLAPAPVALPVGYPFMQHAALGAVDSVSLSQIMFGMLCVMIGKTLNNVNSSWLTKRATAISKKIGLSNPVMGLVIVQCFGNNNLPFWITISTVLSRCGTARQRIFELLTELGGAFTIYKTVSSWAMSMLAYGHMAYIAMIEEFVIRPNHPVMTLPEVQYDMFNYLQMLAQLRHFDALAKYSRILFYEDQLPSIKRKNFPKLFLAAVKIGIRRRAITMTNFRVFDVAFEQANSEFMSKVNHMDSSFLNTSYHATANLAEIMNPEDLKYLNELAMKIKDTSVVAFHTL
jgi:hypothetical protein